MITQSQGPAAGVSGRKYYKGTRVDGIQLGGPVGAIQQGVSDNHGLRPAVEAGYMQRKVMAGCR